MHDVLRIYLKRMKEELEIHLSSQFIFYDIYISIVISFSKENIII